MVTAFEPVVGLEVHAELATRSKMFCACPVLDTTLASPNSAVCPVCAGMPGVLPVVNRLAVEYGLRVALALECQLAHTSLFARKNYFYPDLPKGYQISQYEYPLAQHGRLAIQTAHGERTVRIRRVHLEEDTGKLIHVSPDGPSSGTAYSLVDLNRAGVPLLEIVSEPDLHSVEEVRLYAAGLRAVLRYLGVNSGDMQKGVIRFEANVSVRPRGSEILGTRVEIKNLNSFRALERSIVYEVQRQSELVRQGQAVRQETVGWDEALGATFTQRGKEEAHDYRYFPEPDLPPLVVEQAWIEQVRGSLPELPQAKTRRFQEQYRLPAYDAGVLVMEPAVADYFEAVAAASGNVSPKTAANWVSGELFGLMNQNGDAIEAVRVLPAALAALLEQLEAGAINPSTAKAVLAEMYATGQSSQAIIQARGLGQISDAQEIAGLVKQTLQDHPREVSSYLAGKETLANWFFGQVMRRTQGQANPQVVRQELERQLREWRVNS
jgi:aspartyl-tRNA(Asn)/glutamyl-tRNA(Gln) amidotransferase subunit B